jgi:hypothetical protein
VKIWLYCLFGNEQRLMPYFLRHYAQECDRLIMLDGGSIDGTRAIISACPNAVIQASPFTNERYDEIEWVNWMSIKYREARFSADWVLVVDADEFLYSGIPLSTALSDYRTLYGVRAIRCQGYQMLSRSFPADNGAQLVDMVTDGIPDRIYNKLAAFDPMLDVTWSVGRHTAAAPGYEPLQDGLKLLHYRYFGDEYLTERNRLNYARRSADDIVHNRGYHGAPDHNGRYSAAWFKSMMAQAERVTDGELLHSGRA